jgi:hypothetical protein
MQLELLLDPRRQGGLIDGLLDQLDDLADQFRVENRADFFAALGLVQNLQDDRNNLFFSVDVLSVVLFVADGATK